MLGWLREGHEPRAERIRRQFREAQHAARQAHHARCREQAMDRLARTDDPTVAVLADHLEAVESW